MLIVLLFKGDGKIYSKNLASFLKTYLELNPFGQTACLRNGKRINPTYIGGSVDPRKVGKIITNANLGRSSDLIVFLTQVLKQTQIETSEAFRNASLYIDKCLYSYIYILQPLKMCSIKKCRRSLILIGPTEKTVTIDSCVECTIVTVCRRFFVRNSSMCTIYLLTPSSPVILSGCDNIKLAPFNSSYPNIIEDAYSNGLSDSLNSWDRPTVVVQNQSLMGSHWSLMPSSEFSLLNVPVEFSFNRSQASSNELINRANVSSFFKHLIFF